MNEQLCFGQKIDPELGVLFPWYTHGALDVIKGWDLKDKIVLEYGCGDSTIWWGLRAFLIYSSEHNYEWANKIRDKFIQHGLDDGRTKLFLVDTHEGDQTVGRKNYIHQFDRFLDRRPNIVIVDGIHRYECIEHAFKTLKPEILIVDNWQQDYVFICPAADELLKDVKREIYTQPDHTNHEGCPWATAIFYLNEYN